MLALATSNRRNGLEVASEAGIEISRGLDILIVAWVTVSKLMCIRVVERIVKRIERWVVHRKYLWWINMSCWSGSLDPKVGLHLWQPVLLAVYPDWCRLNHRSWRHLGGARVIVDGKAMAGKIESTSIVGYANRMEETTYLASSNGLSVRLGLISGASLKMLKDFLLLSPNVDVVILNSSSSSLVGMY